MRVIIQRVSSASVTIDGKQINQMGEGLLLLLGIKRNDTEKEVEYLVNKCINLRIFDDKKGMMNQSLVDLFKKPECMVVSNFTLYGDTRKGRRPSFVLAAPANKAEELYNTFISEMKKNKITVHSGTFGSHMDISLVNKGPVTLIIDTDNISD